MNPRATQDLDVVHLRKRLAGMLANFELLPEANTFRRVFERLKVRWSLCVTVDGRRELAHLSKDQKFWRKAPTTAPTVLSLGTYCKRFL